MTSEQAMSNGRGIDPTALFSGTVLMIALASTVLVALGGCQWLPEKVEQPHTYPSPYPAPKLWAVAPFRNESGVSRVDGAAFADRLTQRIQQVERIDALPVNRVLAAMDAARIDAIRSVDQARQLIDRLGVDGLLVGTITAWDPYEPPKIGVQAQLYTAGPPADPAGLDPRALSAAPSPPKLPGLETHVQPVAQVGSYFDAANGRVLRNLKGYAHGRTPPDAAAGWRRYLIDMDLYSEFVSQELTRRLFAHEWRRLRNRDLPAQGAGKAERTATRGPSPSSTGDKRLGAARPAIP